MHESAPCFVFSAGQETNEEPRFLWKKNPLTTFCSRFDSCKIGSGTPHGTQARPSFSHQKNSSLSLIFQRIDITIIMSPAYTHNQRHMVQKHDVPYVRGQFDDSPDDETETEVLQNNKHPSHLLTNIPKQNSAGKLGTRSIEYSSLPEKGNFSTISSIPSGKVLLVHRTQGESSGALAHNCTLTQSMPTFPSVTASPTDNDILCGRGGKTNNHSGNKEFRLLIDLYRQEYFVARKPRKSEISQSLVSAIYKHNGRFLKLDKKTGLWHDIGHDKAIDKTSQALREGAATKLRSILSRHILADPAKSDASRESQVEFDAGVHGEAYQQAVRDKKRRLEEHETSSRLSVPIREKKQRKRACKRKRT